jgi:membrane-associated phospholipid phosphatase
VSSGSPCAGRARHPASTATSVLTNHRRAIGWSAALLGAMVFVFAAVGRHPPTLAPTTTIPLVGEWDLTVLHWTDDVRSGVLTSLARFLNVLGGGFVTIPLRIAVAIWLLVRTRWRALAAWLLTWAVAELVLAGAKTFFHRGRPPDGLVDVVGYSFPSGHAVAGAATAVALVLVLLPAGPERRRWELAAIAFAFVMALSRVYLQAHWFSDVVAGVLLGAGVALGSVAAVTEIRDVAMRRRARAAPAGTV